MNVVAKFLKQPKIRPSHRIVRRRRLSLDDSARFTEMSQTRHNASSHSDSGTHFRNQQCTKTSAPHCDVCFDRGFPGLTMRLANTLRLRQMAWSYVYHHYREKVLARFRADGYWYGPHDLRPTTHTFLVENQDHIQGTITLLIDDENLRLPADSLFKKELKQLRKDGSALAEVVSPI